MPENKQGEKKIVSQQKPRPTTEQTKKKTKKSTPIGTVISIILVIAIVAVLAMVYFDIAGLKQKAVSLLKIDVPTDAQLATANEQLLEAETKLGEIEQREIELEQKSDELASFEQELLSTEQQLNGQIAQQENAKKLEQEREEALAVSAGIFELMDVRSAANAISKLETVEEMASLLMNMTSEKAAQILDMMDSKLASEILSEMITQ